LPGRKSGTDDDDDDDDECSETKKISVKDEWEHFGKKILAMK
jgi:hypothetical protein